MRLSGREKGDEDEKVEGVKASRNNYMFLWVWLKGKNLLFSVIMFNGKKNYGWGQTSEISHNAITIRINNFEARFNGTKLVYIFRVVEKIKNCLHMIVFIIRIFQTNWISQNNIMFWYLNKYIMECYCWRLLF